MFWNLRYLTNFYFDNFALSPCFNFYIRRGADKSLARPGRKQATATKFGIYSTYSPRSSIHFLGRCSNFCKPLKKNSGLRGSNDLRVGRKMANFQLFFQSKEQVVVRRVQTRRIGWVIKKMGAQVGQFLLGCKCPLSRSIVVQEQDPLGEFLAAFFLQNILQLHQQGWAILRVDSLALLKIMPSWSQKIRGEDFSSGFLHLEFFGTGWDAMSPLLWLLLCLRVIVI